MPRPPAAQRSRKSKFDSAHVTSGHLEVLHAKFHDRATSNLGDKRGDKAGVKKKSGRVRLRRNAAENQNSTRLM